MGVVWSVFVFTSYFWLTMLNKGTQETCYHFSLNKSIRNSFIITTLRAHFGYRIWIWWRNFNNGFKTNLKIKGFKSTLQITIRVLNEQGMIWNPSIFKFTLISGTCYDGLKSRWFYELDQNSKVRYETRLLIVQVQL